MPRREALLKATPEQKEHYKQYKREWYQRNKEHVLEYASKYARNNKPTRNLKLRKRYGEDSTYKGVVLARNRDYSAKRDRGERNAYAREYYARRSANDPKYRARKNLRARFAGFLKVKGKTKNYSFSKTILNYTKEELAAHLESKFLPGMTWDNYGLRGWHIDHIKPLSLFDPTDAQQVKEAYALSNLQPLWAPENLRKGNKYSAVLTGREVE